MYPRRTAVLVWHYILNMGILVGFLLEVAGNTLMCTEYTQCEHTTVRLQMVLPVRGDLSSVDGQPAQTHIMHFRISVAMGCRA